MPKEAREGQYRTRYDQTKFRSLVDICLDVHMHTEGSSDDLSPQEYERDKETLAIALNNWREEHPRSKPFDDAVKNLIRATLNEVAPGVYESELVPRREYMPEHGILDPWEW